MSSERLARIDDFVQEYIDTDRIAGAVTLVARKGKVVHFEAQGWRDRESGVPMTRDTVFVLMSMTKPVVSAALMMLFEEGEFLLDDPIAKWIPEYANHTVRINRRRRAAAGRARGAAGDRAPRADAHLGIDAQSAGARPERGADQLRHEPRPGLADAGRAGGPCGRDSGRVPSRRRVAVRRLDRLRRRPRREDLREVDRRLPARADLRAARHDRHLLLRAAGEGRAHGVGLPPGRERQDRTDDQAELRQADPHVPRHRGAGGHRGRLLPLRADDRQRRRARRRPAAGPDDGRQHDQQPHRAPTSPSTSGAEATASVSASEC